MQSKTIFYPQICISLSDLKSQERCSGHKTFEIFVILNRLAKWLPI